jgi:hypothetical protein
MPLCVPPASPKPGEGGSGFLLSEFQLFPQGKHLYDAADAGEKRAVGAVWESRSDGKCLFVMPTEGDFSVITTAVKLR